MQELTDFAPEKLTILHVLPSLEIGGMEQIVSDLVQGIDRSRFLPVVACLKSLGRIAEEVREKGIEVILISEMLPIFSFLYPAPLYKLIRQRRPAVVHIHSGCLCKAAIAATLAGTKKIIYTDHGRNIPDPSKVIFLDGLYSRLTDNIVAVSEDLAGYLQKVIRMPSGKMSVILNGIHAENFSCNKQEDAGAVCIGIIARLMPIKDVPTLLQAMRLVSDRYPDVKLQIVGDGPERSKLEKLVQDLDLNGKVNFFGFRRDIAALLSGMDIFALSSLSEGTSVTILEAMAAEKPIVATKVGGNPALVQEGVNGFLVDPGEPAKLADALLMLVKNEDLRKRMGEANRVKSGREYGIAAMIRKYEELYTS